MLLGLLLSQVLARNRWIVLLNLNWLVNYWLCRIATWVLNWSRCRCHIWVLWSLWAYENLMRSRCSTYLRTLLKLLICSLIAYKWWLGILSWGCNSCCLLCMMRRITLWRNRMTDMSLCLRLLCCCLMTCLLLKVLSLICLIKCYLLCCILRMYTCWTLIGIEILLLMLKLLCLNI